MFETGAVLLLLTVVWLELTTTAVFDLLPVFVVELFDVVFVALLQAEKSNAKEAMLNIDKVAVFKIFIFLLITDLSIRVGAFKEAGLGDINHLTQGRC